MTRPIFYDPKHRRWPRVKRAAKFLAAILSLLFLALIASVLVDSPLPTLALVQARLPSSPVRPAAQRVIATPAAKPAVVVATANPAKALPSVVSRSNERARFHPSAARPMPSSTHQPYLSRIGKQPHPGQTARPAELIRQPGATLSPTESRRRTTALPPAVTPGRAQPSASVDPHQQPGRRATILAELKHVATATPTAATVRRSPATSTPAATTVRPGLAGAASIIQTPTPTIRPGTTVRPEIIAYYVNWDDTSFASLRQNISRIDTLVPEWLHLSAQDPGIALDDPARQVVVGDYIKAHRPELRIMPLINNYSNQTQDWDSDLLSRMLDSSASRGRTIQALLDFVRLNHAAGISIDFENISPSDRSNLTAFMRELYDQFHPAGLAVSESVPVLDDSFDYQALAQNVDYLILMAYDEHWSGAEPGPVASQAWFASSLRKHLSEVSPDKYVIAFGAYGYDWSAAGAFPKSSASGTAASPSHSDGMPVAGGYELADEISFQAAVRTADLAGAPIQFDAQTLNPYIEFNDETGRPHQIWFLDAVTAFNQVFEAQRYRPRGYAFWRLGSEDPSLWQILEHGAQVDRSTADLISSLHYGYDLDYEGRGEVVKLAAAPQDGARQLSYDERAGLLTNEVFSVYPSPYVLMRWGADRPRSIALTFDDGPDAIFTSPVLDILKRYNVPATFFVIGSSAGLNPQLLRRIVAEGHEVGNHTFTHPDISAIAGEQFGVELNATERLFESQLGLHSLLFRPPYGEDIEPERPDQLNPLVLTSKLGYFTVGMHIDPNDWRNPGSQAIVQSTLSQVLNGDGNVVLLHDGGGDRTQTLLALPQIIEGLRAQGYEFVTVSSLLGLSHDEVMPPLNSQERVIANINDAGFTLLNAISWLIADLFMLGIVLGIARALAIAPLAIIQSWRTRRQLLPPEASLGRPLVAVVVPAYNEVNVICRTVEALLASSYPDLDIVVVDDGSTDGTYETVSQAFAGQARVRVFRQPNSGKAQALNFGVAQTRAPIIVAQDADTLLQPDAIAHMVEHFADARVGAVAGNAKVGNRVNLLTEWQAVEYITSQNLDRRAFDLLNCITVVPGAVGAWRRDILLQAGGFQDDTLAEDAALTMAFLRMGYRVRYEERAVALTEAPDTVRALLRQRFRWMYGTLQAVWKNRDTLFRPRYRTLGFVALPNVLVFQIFFPFIAPLMDLLMLSSLAVFVLKSIQHPQDVSSDALTRLLFFYILFVAIDLGSALLAFALEPTEDWRLLVWLVLQRFCYRQLLYFIAIKSTLTAVRGSLVGWGKLERKATVHAPTP